MSIRVVFSLEAYGPDGPIAKDPECHLFCMKQSGDLRTVGLAGGFPFLDVDREADVYPELTKFISGYEITSTAFRVGGALRNRGIYREGSAVITLKESQIGHDQAYSLTGYAKNFTDLDTLYRKIRAGQICPEEDWDSVQGSTQLDDLRRQLGELKAECHRFRTRLAYLEGFLPGVLAFARLPWWRFEGRLAFVRAKLEELEGDYFPAEASTKK